MIPMYLIIGVWGGRRRVYAVVKFFLFTLTGSVLMLLAMIASGGCTPALPGYFASLMDTRFSVSDADLAVLRADMASFQVEGADVAGPHWLPDAHVEAPTAGSVILAGVLLKMGAYGFLRFSVPMLPDASQTSAPFVFTHIGHRGDLYVFRGTLAQEDMKKLIAYSSVAHMGVVTIGIFTFNEQGAAGCALFQMLSHGIGRFGRAVFDLLGWFTVGSIRGRSFGARRPCRPDAGLCADIHGVHHGNDRIAWHLGVYRRVPGDHRRGSDQFLVGAVRRGWA